MLRILTWILPALGFLTCFGTTASADDKKAEEKKGTVVTIDGLKSAVPGDWKTEEPTSRMRAYQFKLPRAADDKYDGEMAIFFFGPGQGGSAEENIKRWKGFFLPPQGKNIDDVAKVSKLKVGAVDVHYLDVQGTYKFKERPFDPNAKEELRPDWRMLGVVFESKNGPYFMRLAGPAKTVAHHKKGFDDWLQGLK
jgi:hypothetical protein